MRTYRPDEVHDKIRTTQILNRLQEHTLADGDIMTPSQVQAARILLGKVMPDVKQIEVGGMGGGPVEHHIVLEPHASMNGEHDDTHDEG